MMIILGHLASVLMGLTLGMIGGGGSILTVPILVYLFGLNPLEATAYSLLIVGLTALIGGVTYFKKGEVDLKVGATFALPSFVGIYLTRAYLVPWLPDPVFSIGPLEIAKPLLVMLVFALLMVVASFSMIKKKKVPSKDKVQFSALVRILLIVVEGLVVGAVTGFVGAGGGFLIVPALVLLVGLPMRLAVGTSLFIIAMKSLIGFAGDLQSGMLVDWALLFGVCAAGALGMVLGLALSSKVSEVALRKGFGFFVLIMGSIILVDQLSSL